MLLEKEIVYNEKMFVQSYITVRNLKHLILCSFKMNVKYTYTYTRERERKIKMKKRKPEKKEIERDRVVHTLI